MRIGSRILTNSVLIAGFAVLITTLLIGGMAYNYGKDILEQQAMNKLELVRDLKADSLKRYFVNVENQAKLFARSPGIISATQDLEQGFDKYAAEVGGKGLDRYKDTVIQHYIQEFSSDYATDNGGAEFDATPYLNLSNESTFALQYNYIFNNPNGIDKESKLDAVEDGSTYSRVHKKVHVILKEFKEMYDFEDIFLVDSNTGDIVYTVAKGLDFTTSLNNGPFSKTALADVFRRANAAEAKDYVTISDFSMYMPSNDDQAAFVAAPIYNGDTKIGVLIFQLNLKTVNQIMTSDNDWKNVGLGDTGETYLIDQNSIMMNMSRFFVENPDQYLNNMAQLGLDPNTIAKIKAKNSNIGLQQTKSHATDAVLNGNTGFGMFTDYRGVEVLGAYEPINLNGTNWGIICKIDKSEAFAPIKELAKKVIINLTGVMILIMIFSIITGIGLARQISLPIERLSSLIRILSKTQDLTQRIEISSNDEIGEMAASLNTLIESFQQTCQETITSSQKMQIAAHRLMTLADEIDSREAGHKFEDNFETVHEKTEAIKNAGDSLSELSSRLQVLSRQFKVFEVESDRTSGW